MSPVSEKRYLIRFDTGEENELLSAVLKVESVTAFIPPDVPVSVVETVREEALLKNGIADTEQDAADT